MAISSVSIIGFIVSGITGLIGGLMLLGGGILRLRERKQQTPSAIGPGVGPAPASGQGRGGTKYLPEPKCHRCGASMRFDALFCGTCGTPRMVGERYKILHPIGQGGMGAVFLVEDQRLRGKQWAIKEMSDAAITNQLDRQAAVEAFQKEAELLAKLEHPNLPKVVDFLSQGNNHYLVMDYIEGRTLEDLLSERQNPFSEIKVVEWAGQLCDVLGYLHNQNPPIIFRDLKPANIMVIPTGQVKLIDFGIARLFKPGKSGDTLKLGTPGYAPPEQFGSGQTDARSDVYSLGVTLHQLLTKYDPTDNPFNLPPVRKLNPKVSVKVEQVISQATQPNASHRFQTMVAIRQALGIN